MHILPSCKHKGHNNIYDLGEGISNVFKIFSDLLFLERGGGHSEGGGELTTGAMTTVLHIYCL